jgi:DNA-binding NarL/FixJ family response regulator
MSPTTRVLAFGGHPAINGVVRIACASSPSLELVAETEDPEDVVRVAAEATPDVIIFDADLREADPALLIRQLQAVVPSAAVLALSDRSDGRSVLEILRSGASGYLVKADGLKLLGEAVASAASGRPVLDPALEQAAIDELGRFARRQREASAVATALTSRERDVLALLADGATARQIGRRLGISPRTVETHVANVYRKLGARTRVQAIGRAVTMGLVGLG